MKKNIFLYIFLVLVSLAKIQTSFGFLSDPLGLDLYEKIDKGVYELDLKYIEKELKGGDVNGSIKEQLEKVEKIDLGSKAASCYSTDFTSEEIKKIATIEDSNELLYKKLENCNVDGSIDALTFTQYHDMIKKYYDDAKQSADDKTKQITKVSRIGLYSDGVEENSPFDLIVDLKDIDKIIFETEIPYNGVNMEDMGVVVDSSLAGNDWDDAWALGEYQDKTFFDNNEDDDIIVAPNKNIQPIKIIDGSNSVCRINDSGLKDEIFDNIGSGTTSTLTGNTDTGDFFPDLPNNNNDDTKYDEYGNPIWSYERVDDSDGWPCNDFFCITIEFVTHSQNLLSFGKSRSIEGFLNKSNKHLKKFANGSEAQAKMTTNFFEFGLKDLNLPDLFHIGVQLSYKPAPILNLDKVNKDESSKKKEDNSDFSSENLLFRYYKNLGLDYERRNDLEIFNKEDEELKTLIDNTGLPSVAAEESYNELNNFRKMIALENNYLSETVIDKKILEEDVSDFYNQFTELETFTKAMMDYTMNLNAIIKNMRSIPISN